MPFVVLFNSGFALNNNPPPSTGSPMPNKMLPLLGVGLIPGLLASIMPQPETKLEPEVSLG